jgi:hypothetical protein
MAVSGTWCARWRLVAIVLAITLGCAAGARSLTQAQPAQVCLPTSSAQDALSQIDATAGDILLCLQGPPGECVASRSNTGPVGTRTCAAAVRPLIAN